MHLSFYFFVLKKPVSRLCREWIVSLVNYGILTFYEGSSFVFTSFTECKIGIFAILTASQPETYTFVSASVRTKPSDECFHSQFTTLSEGLRIIITHGITDSLCHADCPIRPYSGKVYRLSGFVHAQHRQTIL